MCASQTGLQEMVRISERFAYSLALMQFQASQRSFVTGRTHDKPIDKKSDTDHRNSMDTSVSFETETTFMTFTPRTFNNCEEYVDCFVKHVLRFVRQLYLSYFALL